MQSMTEQEKSELIDGAIGELSQFHQTFGYYAHGVDQTTATLPAGWADRRLAGGFGTMLDDMLAALYACAAMFALGRWVL